MKKGNESCFFVINVRVPQEDKFLIILAFESYAILVIQYIGIIINYVIIHFTEIYIEKASEITW